MGAQGDHLGAQEGHSGAHEGHLGSREVTWDLRESTSGHSGCLDWLNKGFKLFTMSINEMACGLKQANSSPREVTWGPRKVTWGCKEVS